MIAVGSSARRILRARRDRAEAALRPTGMGWLLASELFSSALGFGVMVHLARRLGPPSFARVEFASAVAAWLLVVVRGGVDVIVYREAARRPRLVRPLTEVLIGLRLAAALVGYAIVLAMAALVGGDRGAVVAVAGMMLVPSAFMADVGLRASGRLQTLALAQGFRALGYAALALGLVRGPGDVLNAAWCLVSAEAFGTFVPLAWHATTHGLPRPRWRRRAWSVLTYRGVLTGLTRFGRVSLYGADLLMLGWWAAPELGAYAAARRLVFAPGGAGAGHSVGGVADDRPRLGLGRADGPGADRGDARAALALEPAHDGRPDRADGLGNAALVWPRVSAGRPVAGASGRTAPLAADGQLHPDGAHLLPPRDVGARPGPRPDGPGAGRAARRGRLRGDGRRWVGDARDRGCGDGRRMADAASARRGAALEVENGFLAKAQDRGPIP